MSTHVTLGADEHGEVYGLELNPDGKWRRNPLGYSTSCAVIRPIDRRTLRYYTEDPDSAEDLWKEAVRTDRTIKGLEEWFEDYVSECDVFDRSWVDDLLEDEGNPTVRTWNEMYKQQEEDDLSEDDVCDSFRDYVKRGILRSPECPHQNCEDDIVDWEASGWWAPDHPLVVEFAPHELLEEYYGHLESLGKFTRENRGGNGQ